MLTKLEVEPELASKISPFIDKLRAETNLPGPTHANPLRSE
jgi:hypothetical protein